MKTTWRLMGLFAIMTIASLKVAGQDKNGLYWVVEGNTKRPVFTIIHYYNGSNQLIKEERFEGRFLDVRKKRNVQYLNRRLHEILITDTLESKRNRKLRRQGA